MQSSEEKNPDVNFLACTDSEAPEVVAWQCGERFARAFPTQQALKQSVCRAVYTRGSQHLRSEVNI